MTHSPNYEFWGPPLRPGTLFCGKTSIEKNDLLQAKMTIKGMKFQKSVFSNDGFQQHFLK